MTHRARDLFLKTCGHREIGGRRTRRGLSERLAFRFRRRWTVVLNSRERLKRLDPKKPGALTALRKTPRRGLLCEGERCTASDCFVAWDLFSVTCFC